MERNMTNSNQSSNASNLSTEDRSKGGQNSSGNFANDPQRASEAGRKGGENSHKNQTSDKR
jgi:general stress protein YciG